VIQIASSYKIIKSSSNREERKKYLRPLDVEDFRPDIEVQIDDNSENDPMKILEAEIRRELQEETSKKRKAILDAAAAEAKDINEAARMESASEGYNEGFRKGFEDGKFEAEDMRKNAVCMIEDAGNIMRAYFKDCEDKILSLSVKIAEKIVHQTIDSHSENVLLLAGPILHEYGKAENVVITCNPENVDKVRSQSSEIKKICPNATILILEDRSFEKNGIVIENENQITDLQIKKQLDRFLELANS
jgi:flagellar assembly protein FliH